MANQKAMRTSGQIGGLLDDKEQTIKEFAPIIKYMAYRLSYRLPPDLDVDDLINAGVIGLLDAIEKYDPSKETMFKTYAEFRIRGAMLDEIRSMDWVPRSVREKIAIIQRAYHQIGKDLGRPASEEEVAGSLDMDLNEFHDLLFQAKGTILIRTEDIRVHTDNEDTAFDSIADNNAVNPLSTLLATDTSRFLGEAIDQLPEREKQVISLYYYDEMTMKEIGMVLGITESRVSQLHTQAILRLKGHLASEQVSGH